MSGVWLPSLRDPPTVPGAGWAVPVPSDPREPKSLSPCHQSLSLEPPRAFGAETSTSGECFSSTSAFLGRASTPQRQGRTRTSSLLPQGPDNVTRQEKPTNSTKAEKEEAKPSLLTEGCHTIQYMGQPEEFMEKLPELVWVQQGHRIQVSTYKCQQQRI